MLSNHPIIFSLGKKKTRMPFSVLRGSLLLVPFPIVAVSQYHLTATATWPGEPGIPFAVTQTKACLRAVSSLLLHTWAIAWGGIQLSPLTKVVKKTGFHPVLPPRVGCAIWHQIFRAFLIKIIFGCLRCPVINCVKSISCKSAEPFLPAPRCNRAACWNSTCVCDSSAKVTLIINRAPIRL